MKADVDKGHARAHDTWDPLSTSTAQGTSHPTASRIYRTPLTAASTSTHWGRFSFILDKYDEELLLLDQIYFSYTIPIIDIVCSLKIIIQIRLIYIYAFYFLHCKNKLDQYVCTSLSFSLF